MTELAKLARQLDRSEWFEAYKLGAEGRSDAFSFPTESIQKLTNGKTGADTAVAAVSIFEVLLKCLETVGMDQNKELRILDFGCGWGRITRLMPHIAKCERIVGVDVDERLIEAAQRHVPEIRFEQIHNLEKLPFDDGSFDVIFANSVFSHLSENAHRFCISEFSRVLAPGGVAIGSTLNHNNLTTLYERDVQRAWAKKVLGEETEVKARFESDGFLYGATNKWADYGLTICADHWLEKTWLELGLRRTHTFTGKHSGSQQYNLARLA
ncbi:class I SAM-dependent methyltransferase [Maricaulis sp.]|uniref:class I SAM-dependent methyltransferase n=1 Tax=Maricaulis sp. TaxID=1486257 RepID=UPI003A91B0AE